MRQRYCYMFALGTVASRQPLSLPPLVVVAWQVGLGCLAMLVLSLLFEHSGVALALQRR
jgi:hypothetical protein